MFQLLMYLIINFVDISFKFPDLVSKNKNSNFVGYAEPRGLVSGLCCGVLIKQLKTIEKFTKLLQFFCGTPHSVIYFKFTFFMRHNFNEQ